MGELCFGCFAELEKKGECPYCGYDAAADEGKYPSALPAGSILKERYIVGRVLGQGGFGITYAALDFATKKLMAIKEYLPEMLAARDSAGQVKSHSRQREEDFRLGKEGFLEEANTLVAFKENPYIVNIHDFFEENGTAYFVMEFVQGMSLKKYVKSMGGRLGEEEANRILFPVMEALREVHAGGVIHRDIAPDNIIVTAGGSAKLIDFGAARYSTGEKSQSLDVVLKHGYAPKEQYTRRGRQGAYTDVYAMAATYYYTVTGRVPPDAIDRTEEECLVAPSKLGVELSENTEAALLKALQVQHSDRYQTMGEFMQALKGKARAAAASEKKAAEKAVQRSEAKEPALKKPRLSIPQAEGGRGTAKHLIQKHTGLIRKIAALTTLILLVISIGGICFAFEGAALVARAHNAAWLFYAFIGIAWCGYPLVGLGLWTGRRALILPTAVFLLLGALASFMLGWEEYLLSCGLCSLAYALCLMLTLRAEKPLLPAVGAVLSQLAHVIVIFIWRSKYIWNYSFLGNKSTLMAIRSYAYASDLELWRFLLIRFLLCVIVLAVCALPPVTEAAKSFYLKPLVRKIKKIMNKKSGS